MSNPTTPFGWQMPENTDLVTDLPADFEVFGQAVATDFQYLLGGTTGQVLAKASATDLDFDWVTDAAGMTNPMTTTGDSIYSSSGSTPARLGIGTTGQVLTVASGLPSWAANPTNANWTLLNAGGTALTGASTITVSGISSADKIMVISDGASSATASSVITLRFNADSGSNYRYFGSVAKIGSGYGGNNYSGITSSSSFGGPGPVSQTEINLGKMSGATASTVCGYLQMSGANSAGLKIFTSHGMGTYSEDTNHQAYWLGGYYDSASTISSVSILSSVGNFDAGTIFVYTSA